MNFKTLTATVLAFGSTSLAFADKWISDSGNYAYTLDECRRLQNDNVLCIGTVSSLKADQDSVQFAFSDFTVVGPDGTPYRAVNARVGSGEPVNSQYSYFRTPMYKNLPVKIAVEYTYPTGVNVLSRLAYSGHLLSDVPLTGNAAVKPAVAQGAAALNVSGFVISLNDCKVNNGVYTCTATLTPR